MEYKIVEQEVRGVKFKRKYVDKFVVTEVDLDFNEPQESMYAVVLSSLITDKRFTHAEKIVILEISALSKRDGYCYATKGYIAKATNTSVRTIENTIRKMEEYKMAERVFTNKLEDKDGNEHTGTYQRIYWLEQPFEGGVPQNYQGGVGKKVVGGVGKNYQDKTEYNKESVRTGKGGKLQGGTNNNLYSVFIGKFNTIVGSSFRGDSKSKGSFQARLEKYSIEDIVKATVLASKDEYLMGDNPRKKRYLSPEYILREDKLEKWLNSESSEKKEVSNILNT